MAPALGGSETENGVAAGDGFRKPPDPGRKAAGLLAGRKKPGEDRLGSEISYRVDPLPLPGFGRVLEPIREPDPGARSDFD